MVGTPRTLLAPASAAYPVLRPDVLAIRTRVVVVVDLGLLWLRGVKGRDLQRDHLLPVADSRRACDSRQPMPQGLDHGSDVVLRECNDATRVLQAWQSVADSRRPGDSPAFASAESSRARPRTFPPSSKRGRRGLSLPRGRLVPSPCSACGWDRYGTSKHCFGIAHRCRASRQFMKEPTQLAGERTAR